MRALRESHNLRATLAHARSGRQHRRRRCVEMERGCRVALHEYSACIDGRNGRQRDMSELSASAVDRSTAPSAAGGILTNQLWPRRRARLFVFRPTWGMPDDTGSFLWTAILSVRMVVALAVLRHPCAAYRDIGHPMEASSLCPRRVLPAGERLQPERITLASVERGLRTSSLPS
ncbi:hypothetical protein OH77DRAFT_1183778 [Trametes cingulata]|nr:hypothetical protein OH77DRAFT_1183778 [Trametes cingulata]